MAESAISIDTTQFDYCQRMKVKALRLPCGEREECEGCERSPDFLNYQQRKQKNVNNAGNLEEKTCEFCGKTFMGIKKQRFCSLACVARRGPVRTEKICPVCEQKFMGTKQQIYCSDKCKTREYAMRKQQECGSKTCLACGKEFSGNSLQKFCSRKCYYKAVYQRRKGKAGMVTE